MAWAGLAWSVIFLSEVALLAVAFVASGASLGQRISWSSTSGRVIARQPSDHALVRAEYEVNGIRYVTEDNFIGPPNPDFGEVNVGDAVTVFYDPSSPGGGRLSDPSQHGLSAELVVFTLFVAALVPTRYVVFALLVLRKTRLLRV